MHHTDIILLLLIPVLLFLSVYNLYSYLQDRKDLMLKGRITRRKNNYDRSTISGCSPDSFVANFVLLSPDLAGAQHSVGDTG